MTSNVHPIAPRRLLRRAEVMDRVSLAKPTLYSRISAGTFPKPVSLGAAVRCIESEAEAWIAAQISARDHGTETGGTAGGTDDPGDTPPLAA